MPASQSATYDKAEREIEKATAADVALVTNFEQMCLQYNAKKCAATRILNKLQTHVSDVATNVCQTFVYRTTAATHGNFNPSPSAPSFLCAGFLHRFSKALIFCGFYSYPCDDDLLLVCNTILRLRTLFVCSSQITKIIVLVFLLLCCC